ncbi:MAG: RNA polymerase sigma factor [Ardenticatenaceae bacterium]
MGSQEQKIATKVDIEFNSEEIVTDFYQLSINTVVQGCQNEAQRPREEEQGYCFELFRRAVENQDNQAWEALHQQYGRLIHSWIHGRTANTLSIEEREDLIQDIWTNFYSSLVKYSIPLNKNFKHVGALLSYLNKCVITAIIDHQRRLAKQKRIQKKLEMESHKSYSAPDASVLGRISEQKQVEAVKEWIEKNVTDPKEQIVLVCSFEMELKPKEIYERYPTMFSNVQTVYRVKERLLKRARRSFKMAVF